MTKSNIDTYFVNPNFEIFNVYFNKDDINNFLFLNDLQKRPLLLKFVTY